MAKTSMELTVNAGLQIAARNPEKCLTLLADNLYPMLDAAGWFTREWRLKFCAYFLQNLVDQTIEAEADTRLLERLRQMPLARGIKLLGRTAPEPGLKVLVALICIELRTHQKLDTHAQYIFYSTLMARLLPDAQTQQR